LIVSARPVQDALSISSADERQRLDAVLGQITVVATVLPLDDETFRAALALLESRDIPPQDALVYSSISRHMRAN
jgi:hypothetical protein